MSVKMKSLKNGAKAVSSRKGPGRNKAQAGPPQVKVGRDPIQKLLPPVGNNRSSGSSGVAVRPPDEEAQDSPPGGPFPVDALPPVARDLVLQAAAAGRVSVALPAAAVLGVAAAAIGRGLLVENDRGETACNLFVALVAGSGTGKKLVFDRCMTPFANLHHELVGSWQREVRTRLQLKLKAKRRALKDAEDALQDATGTPKEGAAEQRAVDALNEVERIECALHRRPTLHVTDPNRLALARALQGQEGEACAVMSSEAVGCLAGLLGAGMGNGQGSEGFICACYSGDDYSDDRLTRDAITLRNPCLTLVPFVQPDVMRDLLANQKLVDRGLLARFLMVGDHTNQDVPDLVEDAGDVDGPWRELVRALTLEYRMNRQGRQEPVTIRTSAEVRAIFSAYRDMVERDIVPGGRFTDIEPFVRRWAEQAARIALVLHALRHGVQAHGHPLSQATARNAVRIGKWLAAHQVEMLDGYRVSRRRARAEQMRGVLLKHPGRTATLGRLSKSHGFEEKEVRDLCADFPRLFRLEPKPSGAKGGRPTEYVRAAA
jgi:hypothetical protein